MYYANSQQLSEEVTRLVATADPPARWLCLDASAVDDVDFAAAETLRSLYAALAERGVRLVVAEVQDDVRLASRYRLRELIGERFFFDSIDDVIKAYRVEGGGNNRE
jgi:MFS superfamily sulfate permease-like transporter